MILIRFVLVSVLLVTVFSVPGALANPGAESDLLAALDGLELLNVKAEMVDYKGHKALRLSKSDAFKSGERGETVAILKGSNFKNGTIELEIAGLPAPEAGAQARGFVGVVFRMDPESVHNYECFYLRPTNGRAEDQLRRNHTVQYISHPEYTWFKLRTETPGVYESYADLVPGDWTKVKIVVSGNKARLFLQGVEQPCLIVNDLKRGDVSGKIALWIHSTTIAYFRNLTVTEE